MNLLKCPRCGEEYSPSYRRCPFCEEGDHPRKIKYNSSKQSGGRRVSDKKQTQSVRGAMAAVLVVVLLLLSWSLFGDKDSSQRSRPPTTAIPPAYRTMSIRRRQQYEHGRSEREQRRHH